MIVYEKSPGNDIKVYLIYSNSKTRAGTIKKVDGGYSYFTFGTPVRQGDIYNTIDEVKASLD